MKKVLLLIIICCVSLISYAQKSYVSIYINLNDATSNWVSARLSGDVPVGMKTFYAATYDRLAEGDIINMLSNQGFIIEQVAGVSSTNSLIIMSRYNSEAGIITNISADNTDTIEIARYNLQGLSVNENEKGIQIVVYSDYSAKVIVNK